MADRTSTVRVNVITDSSGAGSKLAGFGRLAGAAAIGVGALAVGGALAANKLYGFADAADDANASIEQGLKTMKVFGKQTDEVATRIEDYAKKTSLATAVDINSIKATQAKLLTFKQLAKTADTTGGSFDRATKAAIDMAAKGFGTAEGNAVQLGKALQDPANGLAALGKTGALTKDQIKAIGDEFKRTGDISSAQAQILAAVESQVKGTAEVTAGGFELMKNRVAIFGQELGLKLLPLMDRFGTFMIETGGPALLRFGNALSEKVVPVLRQLGEFIQAKVLPALVSLAGFVQDHVIPAFGKVLQGYLEGARGLFDNVAKSVGKNGPQLQDMGDKLKRLGVFLVDDVLPVLGKFYEKALPAIGTAIGLAITFIAGLVNEFERVWQSAQKVADAIQSVIDKIKNLPSLPDIPNPFGRFSGDSGGAGATGSSSPFQHQPSKQVVVNIYGGVIGNEVDVASRIRNLLDDDLARRGLSA